MSPQELLTLLQGWIDGDVPGEVLCDGMIDAGLDPDKFLYRQIKGILNTDTFRLHFCRFCHVSRAMRRGCDAADRLLRVLKKQGAAV